MKSTSEKSLSFGISKRIGYSFLFLVAILSIVGLFLGIGTVFTNSVTISLYKLEWLLGDGTFLNYILTVMRQVGDVIFVNLPIIFAMTVAVGLAKGKKGVAAISSVISFLIMHKTISTLLELTGKLKPGAMLEGTLSKVCGIESFEMGIFAGLLIGLTTVWLHNKFYEIKLSEEYSFFKGVSFVPVISAFASIFLGILMFFLWPFIQKGIYQLGFLVKQSNYLGTFVYGFIERLLVPFGLNRVFCLPFLQTSLGGATIVDGSYVTGASNIFFAEMISPNTLKFSAGASRFMAGKYPIMMFGLPAGAFAMYTCVKSDKKKIAGSLLILAAVVAMVTGVTEPLEFMFLFVAPMLYVAHCVLAGLSFMLMHLLKVCVGMTFSGGIIEFLLYGIIPGNTKTNWIYAVLIGLAYAVIYYFLFRFWIKKFNFLNPEKEEEDDL